MKYRFVTFASISALFLILFHSAANAESSSFIDITGNSEIMTEADQAVIHLTVNAKAATSSEAKQDIGQRLNAFFKQLKLSGFSKKQIKAGTFSIHADYNYRYSRQVFTGFKASRSVRIELADLKKVHAVLDIAVQHQINNIQQIEYKSTNSASLKLKARAVAIENSKEKAQMLAKAYDVKLGPVLHISYQNQGTPAIRQRTKMAAISEFDDGLNKSRGADFLPESLVIRDSIQVRFQLITD